MADLRSPAAEPFSDLAQQREASTLGIWTFLATEILFFGGLFLCYTVYRHAYPQAFAEASRHTLVAFGTINTAILLSSSFTMVLAVRAIRLGDQKALLRNLLLTAAMGLAFLVVKAFEYRIDLQEQLWPGAHFNSRLPLQAQLFWFLYWVMTGLHALHVTIGIGLLCVIARLAARGRFSAGYHNPVEVAGLYWHFVDIVWIYLYPLLYLIHPHP